tara:strand:+ start:2774 stop:3088 length:315 start_codon:yes stop_codon:yes gene_type:complete
MKLTHLALKDFNNWCLNKGISENYKPKEYSLDVANAMIYSVYVEFFDSSSIIIGITNLGKLYGYSVNDLIETGKRDLHYGKYFLNRNEAMSAAIKKANKIYNNE